MDGRVVRMRQALLEGPETLRVVDAAQPEAGPGEVLVRVIRCGICGSDIHAFKGLHPLVRYPLTPGHEFAGVVEAVGAGADGSLLGARVCVEPSLTCGRCAPCVSGRYNICTDLRVMGFQAPGAFCERIAVPAGKVHLLGEGLGFEAGALAEPLAVGVHALARSGVEPPGRVLVIGTGVIGLMVVAAAVAAGLDVLAVEPDAGRAAKALSLGARRVFSPEEALDRMPDVDEAGAVFECVGLAGTADLAVRLAPRGAVVVIAGVFPGAVGVRLNLVQDGELDMRGTLMYRSEDFVRALELLGRGCLEATGLVSHSVPLQEIEGGYRLAMSPDVPTLKVMVEVGEDG
jgi:L-iditol 2-dehydrogenase